MYRRPTGDPYLTNVSLTRYHLHHLETQTATPSGLSSHRPKRFGFRSCPFPDAACLWAVASILTLRYCFSAPPSKVDFHQTTNKGPPSLRTLHALRVLDTPSSPRTPTLSDSSPLAPDWSCQIIVQILNLTSSARLKTFVCGRRQPVIRHPRRPGSREAQSALIHTTRR